MTKNKDQEVIFYTWSRIAKHEIFELGYPDRITALIEIETMLYKGFLLLPFVQQLLNMSMSFSAISFISD